MKRDGRPEARIDQAPFVDPTTAAKNPAAAQYAAAVAARMGGAKRGGDPVPIPPLNMPHTPGMSMSDQAVAHRPPPGGAIGGIISSDQASQVAQSMSRGILPVDVLPEEARQDPNYREGHGSMYAVNQEHLAYKYGVIRNGQKIAPQQLQTGRPGLSSKTVEGLQAVEEFNKQRQNAASGVTAAEKAATEGPAGSAAQIAGPGAQGVTAEERDAAARAALKGMDDFDFNSFRELMMKDLLNNDDQRKIVEERLSPLDLTRLIVEGRIAQKVPVRPGLYEPELQSLTGEDELALKRLLMLERKTMEAPDRYILDKYNVMTVACGIRSINNTIFPTHLGNDGTFDDDKFWEKFNKVLRLPFHMLASIGVHYYWFDMRVRKLFVADAIKNG